jgi:S1-C subfamily serine protease
MARLWSRRALSLLAATLVAAPAGLAQRTGVLWVSVLLEQADLDVRLVARYPLLVRTPAGDTVARLVTGPDGDGETTLPPGSYVLESERPFEFQDRSYRWRLPVEIRPDQTTRVQLSGDNAEVAPLERLDTGAALRAAFDAWQGSVVTVWGETSRGSGFLVDARGLVVTSERTVAETRDAAVQVSRTLKVAAAIVARSAERNVAVLWVHPSAVAGVAPMRLDGPAPPTAIAEGQPVLAIGSAIDQRRRMTTGTIRRIEPTVIVSSLAINQVNSGGPVLTPEGRVVGIASFGGAREGRDDEASHIVRIEEARPEMQAAERALVGEPPPSTRLPVEPEQAFPVDAIRERLSREPIDQADYQFQAGDFDVTLLTPVLTFGAQFAADPDPSAARTDQARPRGPGPERVDPFREFGHWAEYLRAFPAVLIVDARPRLSEGVGWKVFRGLQRLRGGPALPAKLRFTAAFDRMQLFCGTQEVVPIHAARLAHRVAFSASGAFADDETSEGFSVYPPDAIGPRCDPVTVRLFSRKDPQRASEQVVPAAIVRRVWDDFAPHRALEPREARSEAAPR